jgi:hypothetical protein
MNKVSIFAFVIVGFMWAPQVAEGQGLDAAARASSVVKQMAGFAPEHVYDLERVEKALLAAPPEAFFHIDLRYANDRGEYAPTPRHREDPLSIKTTVRLSGYRTIWNDVYPYSGWKRREIYLENHEPFLVWDVGTSYATVVTLDGAVYRQRTTTTIQDHTQLAVLPGLPEQSKRPEPMSVTYLTPGDIRAWEEMGLIETGVVTELQKLRDAVDECSERVWAGFDRRFDAIEAAAIPYHTREARLDQLADRAESAALRKCRRQRAAFEKAVKAHFEKHLERREAIGKAARSRLEALVKEGSGSPRAQATSR